MAGLNEWWNPVPKDYNEWALVHSYVGVTRAGRECRVEVRRSPHTGLNMRIERPLPSALALWPLTA